MFPVRHPVSEGILVAPPWDQLANSPPSREEEPEPSQPKMESTIQCGQVSMTVRDLLSGHSVALWRHSTCLFLCLCAPVDVAASSICLAIIMQRVLLQGSWMMMMFCFVL